MYNIELALGGDCDVGLTTNEEPQNKLLLMHQASLCEFQSVGTSDVLKLTLYNN